MSEGADKGIDELREYLRAIDRRLDSYERAADDLRAEVWRVRRVVGRLERASGQGDQHEAV